MHAVAFPIFPSRDPTARPDGLLLDEPTHNPGHTARQRLAAAWREWGGCLLVASHDRALLENMNQILALTPSGVRLHGGGFTLLPRRGCCRATGGRTTGANPAWRRLRRLSFARVGVA
jgi:hypothetical protein